MARRFGYEFERESAIRPAVQEARAFFLRLLPQLREEAVPALFDSAEQLFLKFLDDGRGEFAAIQGGSSDVSVRIFTYSWSALRRRDGADELCRALRQWAIDWNLSADWCLDHAVAVLRERYLAAYLSVIEAWHEAIDLELIFGSVCTQAGVVAEYGKRDPEDANEGSEVPDPSILQLAADAGMVTDPGAWERLENKRELIEGLGIARFRFRYKGVSFAVEGPLSNLMFMEEVEQKLEGSVGTNDEEARNAARQQIRQYLRKVRKFAKEEGLVGPLVRPAAQEHFTWLIEYLVPSVRGGPTKPLEEIISAVGSPKQTVWEGIEGAASLLDIKLRRHKPGPKPGQSWNRRLSVRDSTNKAARLHRVVAALQDRNIESNRELANKVGVSPSHFGRAWKPDVLKQAQVMLGRPDLTWEEFVTSGVQDAIRKRLLSVRQN